MSLVESFDDRITLKHPHQKKNKPDERSREKRINRSSLTHREREHWNKKRRRRKKRILLLIDCTNDKRENQLREQANISLKKGKPMKKREE